MQVACLLRFVNQPLPEGDDYIDAEFAMIGADPGASDAAAALDLRQVVNALPDNLRLVVVLRFYGGCGAYAVADNDHSIWGWGKASSEYEAKNRAETEVRNRGGTSATIRVWGCNGA